MKLEVYKSLWGMTGPLEAQLEQAAAAGYAGVETPIGHPPAEFRRLLDRHKLKFIAVFFTGGETIEAHIASFERQLAQAAEYAPVKVTVHSSRDGWGFEDQCRFYDAALRAEGRGQLVVGHETHRGRAMFTPWTTAALLQKFPALRICADFSHWCCVCESLLEKNESDVRIAIPRAVHIHARVGYEEGPQVTDPAAPEFDKQLARHEGWWSEIFAAQKAAGAPVATVTPEFGPPTYQHTLPYTRQPITDLWQINHWMAGRLRQKFAEQPA